jgi:hypothetical protein
MPHGDRTVQQNRGRKPACGDKERTMVAFAASWHLSLLQISLVAALTKTSAQRSTITIGTAYSFTCRDLSRRAPSQDK